MSEPSKGELKAEPGAPPSQHDFYDDPAGVLARHAHEQASLEFHIYKTHYKFSNQEGIIPCNNAAINEFLLAVAQGVILPAATEVFRDSGVRVFEGCYILKIVDHRNETSGEEETPGAQSELKRDFKLPVPSQDKNSPTPDKTLNAEDIEQEKNTPATASTGPSSHSGSTDNANGTSDRPVSTSGNGSSVDNKGDAVAPNSYRILLRPTSLTLWHDMLYTTDASQGRFSDQLALSMESEYLNLTVRSLDLRVPPRSYKKMAMLDAKVRGKDAIKRISKSGRPLFRHRLVYPLPTRKLHEDLPQQDSSTYDDLMTILDERRNATTSNSSNQFMRLACIEQIKKKTAQAQAAAKAAVTNLAPGQPGKLRGAQANEAMNSTSSGPQQMPVAGMGHPGFANNSAAPMNAGPSRYNSTPASMQGRYSNGIPDQDNVMGRQSLNQSQAQQMAEIRARQDQARQRMARSQAQQAQQMAQHQPRAGVQNMQRDMNNVDRSSINDMRAMLQRQQHARQVQQQQMQVAQQAQKVQQQQTQQAQQAQQVTQQANGNQMSQGRPYMMPQMPRMSPHPGFNMPGNNGGHTSQSPMPNEQLQSPGQFDNMNFPPQMMR